MYNLRGQMNHLANHSRDHLPSTQGKMSHLVVFWQICMKIGRPKISWLRNNNLFPQNLHFFPAVFGQTHSSGIELGKSQIATTWGASPIYALPYDIYLIKKNLWKIIA